MKHYRESNESFFISGSQPHKFADRNMSGKTKKFQPHKNDDSRDDFGKQRSSYKRSANKNIMRSQLKEIQLAI